MQMNLDPKLDFGWGTPRMSEVEPVSGQQMLEEAKRPLCDMLDIADEEQWQASWQSIGAHSHSRRAADYKWLE